MNDSRAIDRESRRQSTRSCWRTSSSKRAPIGQDPDARRADGGVATGVYEVEHMAPVDVHAEGRVGGGAASTSRSRESWSGRAPSRRASPRTCAYRPTRSALSNLELRELSHSFARGFCGSAGRIGRVPGFHRTRRGAGSRIAPTILAGFHHERARCRRFRHDRVAPPTSACRIWTRRSGGSARTRTWSFRRGRRVPGFEAGLEGAGRILAGAPEIPALVDRPGHQLQDSASRQHVSWTAACVSPTA